MLQQNQLDLETSRYTVLFLQVSQGPNTHFDAVLVTLWLCKKYSAVFGNSVKQQEAGVLIDMGSGNIIHTQVLMNYNTPSLHDQTDRFFLSFYLTKKPRECMH